MEPKRSKYDTNPLDERVADRAEKSRSEERPRPPTEEVAGGPTRDIGRTANEAARFSPEREAPTRRIDEKGVTSYPSVFIPPVNQRQATYQPPRVPVANIYQPPPVPPPSVYQPPPLPVFQQPGTHIVAGLNIPERWANMLPYCPGYIGLVVSVIELLLVPRSEARSRFHAAQGMALQIGILIVSNLFRILSLATGSDLGGGLFRFAAFIFLIVSMVRVWKGKTHDIAPLDSATKWLDEKIKPRK